MTEVACLIVTNQFPPLVGGAGEVYAALARAAAGRIAVLCASLDYRTGHSIPGWRDHDATTGYPIVRIPRIRPLLPQRGVATDLLVRAQLLTTVWRLHHRYRFPSVCIADDETVGWLIRPVHAVGCRTLLYSHGDDLAVRPDQRRPRARRRRRFAQADRIFAVSAATAAELCRIFDINPQRVTVLPNGVDLGRFNPLPPDEALRTQLRLTGKRVLITVSRLMPRKGIDRMIEALPAIAAAIPDVHYLVIGDGDQREELRRLAAACNLTDRITFAGEVPQEQVPRYLALAELFVMPNRRLPNGEEDGFGLVFLEANACGLPVIGGRAGGVPEVIVHGQTGLLVDGTSVPDISAAVVRVLTDRPLAARLAANGRQRALRSGWDSRVNRVAGRPDLQNPSWLATEPAIFATKEQRPSAASVQLAPLRIRNNDISRIGEVEHRPRPFIKHISIQVICP
jgi:phosphatidyl-myo-inositol dimannoside synthase